MLFHDLRALSIVALFGLVACSTTSTGTGSNADAATDTPIVDTPIVDTPIVDTPIVDTPIVDVPVIDTPVVDTPVVDTPVLDRPVSDAPVCAMGMTMCPSDGGFACVDTNTDRNHCGGCGRTCCAGSACFGGLCPLGCAAGTTRCGCICTNLSSDTANCGACGRACPVGAFCQAGTCVTPDAGADGSTACATVTEPPPPNGVCDGRGRIACTNWATAMLDGGTAFATCVSTPAGCLRADSCADLADTSTCRCGVGLPCAPGQVCALAPGASVPSCRCIATR